VIKILLDINVVLDILLPRREFYLDSFAVLNLCASNKVEGWLSADSYSTVHYYLKKEFDELVARNKIFTNLRSLSVLPVRKSTLMEANASLSPDFEDNMKMAAADQFHLNYIVTRNTKHFKDSPVTALTPAEFVTLFKETDGEPAASPVPFLDLKAQHHQVYNEIDDKLTDVIANTGFILGKYVEAFEMDFAAAQGAKYCIGVSSGTDALHIALLALGIGPGDGVIVPVNTFIATAEAVSLCGATPVFVDCDAYYNVDVGQMEALLESSAIRPKAIIPVHLYGQPANMAAISALADQYGLKIVEDCCQAHLARFREKPVGNFGVFGAFSFFPGKNLGAYGEAGGLIANDEDLYLKAKMIRQHGEIQRYQHQVIGHNYRMEAFQGAVLSVKIKYLADWTEKRRANAARYRDLLTGVEGVRIPVEIDDVYSVYHLFVIQADRREALQQYLLEKGVATGLHYPRPLHLHPAYEQLGYHAGDFPVAEAAAKRILSLPMYPELGERQIRYVADTIKVFYSGSG